MWVRQWHNEHIDKKFEFLMRFRQGPDVWPEVRLLAPENIVSDIQTKACEVELEMFVGQETEIEFELCGVKWIWKALDQTLNCRGYKMKVPTEKGRLYLHFYRDMAIQELYADRKNAMLIVQDDGPKKRIIRFEVSRWKTSTIHPFIFNIMQNRILKSIQMEKQPLSFV